MNAPSLAPAVLLATASTPIVAELKLNTCPAAVSPRSRSTPEPLAGKGPSAVNVSRKGDGSVGPRSGIAQAKSSCAVMLTVVTRALGSEQPPLLSTAQKNALR